MIAQLAAYWSSSHITFTCMIFVNFEPEMFWFFLHLTELFFCTFS